MLAVGAVAGAGWFRRSHALELRAGNWGAAVGEMSLVVVHAFVANCTQILEFQNFICSRAGLAGAAPHIVSVGI